MRHRWRGDLLVAFTQAAVSMLLALATASASAQGIYPSRQITIEETTSLRDAGFNK